MDALLERLTVEDSDLRGQTQVTIFSQYLHFSSKIILQLHNLLELIKEEQNIYNIIFHEIIRQVRFFFIYSS
jgi:hypothetical protein